MKNDPSHRTYEIVLHPATPFGGEHAKSLYYQRFHKEVRKTEANERYLWDGLDLEHFEVIHILPQDKDNAVVIMLDKRPGSIKPWCVEFMGGGQSFDAVSNLMAYCHSRGWTHNKMI